MTKNGTPAAPLTEQEIREAIAFQWSERGLEAPGAWVRRALEGDRDTLATVHRWRRAVGRARAKLGKTRADEYLAWAVRGMEDEIAEWERDAPRREREFREAARREQDRWYDEAGDRLCGGVLARLPLHRLLWLRDAVAEECGRRLLIPLPARREEAG